MTEPDLQEPVFEMDSFFRAIFYRDPRYSLKVDKVGGKGTEETTQTIIEALTKKADITQKEPKIYPHINRIEIDGKICIRIRFKGNDIPYFAYGRAYIRVADEDRQLSAKELEGLILGKNKDKLRWDTEICKEAEITDISAAKVKSFLKDSGLK